MCVYSMVMDYGRTVPDYDWTPFKWRKFKEYLDETKKIDEVLEQPDCEDPIKAAWMKSMEEKMAKMEQKLDKLVEIEDNKLGANPRAKEVAEELAKFLIEKGAFKNA